MLEGAEFELYYRGLDDEYHLFHTQHHITDSNGKIKFDILPIGSYALKEVKAPDGYELPEGDNMYYFNVEKDKQLVKIEIENNKKQGGGGGGGTTDPKPPVDPDKPSPPIDPDKPTPEPEKPSPEKPEIEEPKPEKPEEPEIDKPDPENPDKPGTGEQESENQDKPEKPNSGDSSGNSSGTTTNKPNSNSNDKTNSSKNDNKTPQTGDNGNLIVWGSVFLIASIVLIALLRKSKKNKK